MNTKNNTAPEENIPYQSPVDPVELNKVFELSDEEKNILIDDEDELLQFACRFLKQVLYGEHSIPTRENARQSRLNRIRPVS